MFLTLSRLIGIRQEHVTVVCNKLDASQQLTVISKYHPVNYFENVTVVQKCIYEVYTAQQTFPRKHISANHCNFMICMLYRHMH